MDRGPLARSGCYFGCHAVTPCRSLGLVTAGIEGINELVPAARTIYVEVDTHCRTRREVLADIRRLAPGAQAPTASQPRIEIQVRYDGQDLDTVSASLKMTPDELIEHHTGQRWVAAFAGFAPGFIYLVGENLQTSVPRREQPRVAVPNGAVAMAGPFTGIYPRESTGGWQIIGRTDAVLWDLDRDSPALIPIGARVKFVAR